jgi:ABC-type transport system involved in multi-copper enzyme maturation permease subunit
MSSALVIAALTLKRLVRGRAVWVSAIIAMIPVAFAFVMSRYSRQSSNIDVDIMVFETLVLAVLPAMFVASSVGEDIEDRTTTYLWSRPIPRWAVLAGKLIALAPLVAALMVASWTLAVVLGTQELPTAQSTVSLGLGAIVVCIVAAAIATVVPKHGMPLTIAYMLFFDLPVGAMPISLAEMSVTHHIRQVGHVIRAQNGQFEDPVGGLIGLGVLAVLWLAFALWRVRRLEA